MQGHPLQLLIKSKRAEQCSRTNVEEPHNQTFERLTTFRLPGNHRIWRQGSADTGNSGVPQRSNRRGRQVGCRGIGDECCKLLNSKTLLSMDDVERTGQQNLLHRRTCNADFSRWPRQNRCCTRDSSKAQLKANPKHVIQQRFQTIVTMICTEKFNDDNSIRRASAI